MGTDAEWEAWGKRDPYFGVLTDHRYRSASLTDELKAEFFETGRRHVEHVLDVCRRRLDPGFAPKRVLDFGCGTGRLVLPFSHVADEVTGVDVSASMLAEARANCEAQGVENVALLPSDDSLSAVTGKFDLVHSWVVFQHIPAARGTRLLGRLVECVAPGGIGAIQLTYSKQRYTKPKYRRHLGVPPWYERARIRLKRMNRKLRRTLLLRRRDPELQMNMYNLNQVFFQLQTRLGVREIFIEALGEWRSLSLFLFFRRPTDA